MGSLTRIDEEDEEDQNSENYDQKASKKKSKAVRAELFDFRLNNQYYIINIQIDEKGERIKAMSNLQGRVVSRTPISYSDPLTQLKTGRESVGIQY
mmetsp:Transcript_4400/g.6397  ORF Transcript_4400/g.6397 Transcript_4400/m.6397 type:complete len:96 (-) Transcript_4400:575-862(-)